MYRRILLAYDGSVEGRLALREGARLARLCEAQVCLLAVVQISTGIVVAEGVYPGVVGEQSEVYKNILAEGERQLRDIGFEPDTRLAMGDPGPEIRAVAKEINADLVVIGHRQHGTLARWWSGSVATYLIDHLDCSMLIGRMEVSDAEFDRLKPSYRVPE
ncbi:universal stress protein [Mesorhizobium sp. KR9-304]|uniref:universal stress protein n=1 Tax=Mesorhizobium sp. KR9-304 TaxID=3156614 RepID=UPI0032B49138